MDNYTNTEKVIDLDNFMRSLDYRNGVSDLGDFEYKRFRNLDIHAEYKHRKNTSVCVDFYWGTKKINPSNIPPSYPKDGIIDGKVIWESCFAVSIFTPDCIRQGRARQIILPTFSENALVECIVKANMRNGRNLKIARCSESQLKGLEAILRRFDETGVVDGIEIALSIPCELVVH